MIIVLYLNRKNGFGIPNGKNDRSLYVKFSLLQAHVIVLKC